MSISSNIKEIPKKFFSGAIFIVVVLLGGIFLWSEYQVIEKPKNISSTQEHDFWREYVLKNGAQNAYEEFTESVQNESRGQQHEMAHIFGGAMYQAVGVEGLVVCDSRFDYGCFHEFLGRAIAELGLQSVEELNSTCITMLGEGAGFCQHGLGHGVQSYFGYTDKDFYKALDACRNLPGNDPIGGCNGGIYMEYNLRSMLADERVIRESTDLLHPCNKLEGKDAETCYFWQPQWWYEVFLRTGEGQQYIFTELAKQCESITAGEKMVLRCFQGIGNMPQGIGQTMDANFCNIISKSSRNRAACEQYFLN